jgi:hypothetical protein
MKSDSVNNKLRLSEALQKQSIQNQPKDSPAELATTADRIGDRSSDAVRTTVDSRLSSESRTTGSGRSVQDIKELVKQGNYLKETAVSDIASAVARDLL